MKNDGEGIEISKKIRSFGVGKILSMKTDYNK